MHDRGGLTEANRILLLLLFLSVIHIRDKRVTRVWKAATSKWCRRVFALSLGDVCRQITGRRQSIKERLDEEINLLITTNNCQ